MNPASQMAGTGLDWMSFRDDVRRLKSDVFVPWLMREALNESVR